MTPSCLQATAGTPVNNHAQSDVSTTTGTRNMCIGVASANPMPTLATNNAVDTGPIWQDTTLSRSPECLAVPTTSARPASYSVTASSPDSRPDAPHPEAWTVRLQAINQQSEHLSCRLDDIRREVQEILEIEGDHARVDWAPTRLAINDLRVEMGGRPLLKSVRRFERLADGLCRVHWLPSWQLCTELFKSMDPAGLVEQSGTSLFRAPATILSVRRRTQDLDYLVNLKPTLLSSADVGCKRYLGDFDVKNIYYIGNDVWGIVWEPIWVNPRRDCGSLDWEDLWDDIHSDWTMCADGGSE